MKNRPQVILLGNGINLAYGGTSWGELLKKLAKREDLKEYLKNGNNRLTSPMPLQAIFLTEDNIDSALKNYKEEAFGKIENDAHAESLRKILSIGADHILTTNYSYETEFAVQPDFTLSEDKIIKMQTHTGYVKRAEGKYMLSTFNQVQYNGIKSNVWHIHGEARKPSSMVLGHYYYGNLLYVIKSYVERNEKRYLFADKNKCELHIKSWIDAFIFGDVYVLGFGFDLAEMDLWWLLNRKKRENAEHGELYFYEPKKEFGQVIDERLELIRIFAHKYDGIQNMGVTVPAEGKDKKTAAYLEFYEKAIQDIANRIKRNGGNKI